MNKSNVTGWKDIFTFTLIQTLKNKAFIVSYIILIVLALISMPLINMISITDTEDQNQPVAINKIYVNNQTNLLDMDFNDIETSEALNHIVFDTIKEDHSIIIDKVEQSERESAILNIIKDEGTFRLDFVISSNGQISNEDRFQLSSAIADEFERLKNNQLGITEDQSQAINSQIITNVSLIDVDGNLITEADTSISYTEYWFVYGLLFIIMMVNIMASTQIATSIVTEKSTRVVEYLLISVKPLALMVGKILSMLSAVLIQMVSLIIIFFVSNRISSALSTGNDQSTLSHLLPIDIFNNLNIINIVFCLILVILGMTFYAALAGLAGATVSRLEEVGEGLTLFTLVNLVGVYIGLGAANVLTGPGVNGYVIFSLLFPLSSPFLLPGAILIGKASPLLIAGAIVLQIAFIILLFQFVARVYETVILHNGSKIKIKELFKLSKSVTREGVL